MKYIKKLGNTYESLVLNNTKGIHLVNIQRKLITDIYEIIWSS